MDIIDIAIKLGMIAAVFGALVNVVPIMVWVERRGSAMMQNRRGPNRIGPFGLLQSLADGVKFIWKEDRIPAHVDRFYYILAPIVSLIPAFMTFAVIPFASTLVIDGREIVFQLADLNIGIIYILSITSLSVYGIILAAWSSNNKYALLGGLRSSAQMISYELSMGIALVGVLMVFSSVSLRDIALMQGQTLIQLGPIAIPKWGVFVQPLGFLIFLTTVFAETNRLPFDLPEGESEIIAGYHLEYGSMKFALFFMAEYVNMTIGSAVIATLYFGGWQLLPGMDFLLQVLPLSGLSLEIARIGLEISSFLVKVFFFLWFFVWVRWTIPRFRFDQVMTFGWKFLLPLSLLNLVLTSLMIYFGVI